jgi:hypothetical protein
MKNHEEQCVCVKFCFKLAKTFTETFQMLKQAYGEDCLSCTQCYEWYQRFKTGRMSTEDDPKPGWPSTSMDDDPVEKVHAVIRENRCLTVCEVSHSGWENRRHNQKKNVRVDQMGRCCCVTAPLPRTSLCIIRIVKTKELITNSL